MLYNFHQKKNKQKTIYVYVLMYMIFIKTIGRDKAKIKNNYLCFICELKLLVCLIEELLAGGDLVLETRDQLNLGVQLLAQPRFVENPSTSSSIYDTQHFKTKSSLSEEDNFLQKQQEKTNLVAASRPAPACSI